MAAMNNRIDPGRQRHPLARVVLGVLSLLPFLLLAGCATSGNRAASTGSRPSCPPSMLLVKVDRTADVPTYRCVLKADMHALLDRPTDDGRIQ